MARSIEIVKKELTSSFMSNTVLQNAYGFANGLSFSDVFSIVSIENILFDIIAFSIYMLELIFDTHTTQIDNAIYENKPGTARWYRNMALKFQYGFDLLNDDDEFDNNGSTTDDIESSKIIKYCSVKESVESSRLIIKIAGETAGELSELLPDEITAFNYYLSEVAYAGVKLNVVNNPADKLLLNLQVFRNPLVIDSAGNNIELGGKPIDEALKVYMKNLPFDGELVINDMIDFLRDVPGIINVHVASAKSSYKDLSIDAFTDFQEINIKTTPLAGYFKIETNSIISYVV